MIILLHRLIEGETMVVANAWYVQELSFFDKANPYIE